MTDNNAVHLFKANQFIAKDKGCPKYFIGIIERETPKAFKISGKGVMLKKKMGICSLCGRKLTNANSIVLGIGPICAVNNGIDILSGFTDKDIEKELHKININSWFPKSCIEIQDVKNVDSMPVFEKDKETLTKNEKAPKIEKKATKKGDKLVITFPFDPQTLIQVKSLSGRRYQKEPSPHWICPDTIENRTELKSYGFDVPDSEKIEESNNSEKENKMVPKFPAHLDKVLFPYQKEGVKFLFNNKGRALIGDEQGLGKAQPLYSIVYTDNGPKKMKNIKKGDKVFSSDGKIHNVIGTYYKGTKKIYKVTFTDGSTTHCCDEHLWVYMTDNHKRRNQGWHTDKLKRIKELKTPKWIPITKPLKYPKQNYKIHPYTLGVLLGDGYLTGYSIGLSVANIDSDIIKYIKKESKDLFQIGYINEFENHNNYLLKGFKYKNNPLLNEIRKLDLRKKSKKKFIPKQYLIGSVKQRKELLAGLLDTDGSCQVKENGSCSVSFSTKSIKLAYGVRDLVMSLGGRSKIHKYNRKKEGKGIIYNVNIFVMFNPFKTKRKKDSWIKPTGSKPSRYFKSIKYLGKKKCKCIAVDSPNHTYLTDNYIVTHNTIQSITYSIMDTEIKKILIICPASLKLNWMKEYNTWASDFNLWILQGKPNGLEKKAKIGFSDLNKFQIVSNKTAKRDIVIINWDIIGNKQTKVKGKKKPVEHLYTGWVDYLIDMNFDLVIADEIHFAKNPQAQRTKAIQKIGKRVQKFIPMSGTPITNRPIEFWTCLNLLNSGIFNSYWNYAKKYCGARHNGYGWDFSGNSNTKQLNEILKTVMIRRLKKDVLKELPDKIHSVVPMEINNRKEYQFAEDNLISYLKETQGQKAADKAKQAETLVKIENLKQLTVKGKINSCINWIKDYLESNDKLVVFCHHKETIKTLESNFKKISVTVDGSTKNEDRQKAVDLFQNNPDIKLFFGNIKAAGTGLTLTEANGLCFIEFGWTPGEVDQCSDRIHRIGQKADCVNIYYLVGDKTIDIDIMKMLDEKRKVLDSVLDGKKEESISLINMLLEKGEK